MYNAISCAILDDKSLKCWGYNQNQEIDDMGQTIISRPVTIGTKIDRKINSLGAGYFHTCVITEDKILKCVGYNVYGQLGIGSTTNQNTPQTVDLGVGRTAKLG